MSKAPTNWHQMSLKRHLVGRRLFERCFRFLGLASVFAAGGLLFFLVTTISLGSIDGFRAAKVRVDLRPDQAPLVDLIADTKAETQVRLKAYGLRRLTIDILSETLQQQLGRAEQRRLLGLVSIISADELQDAILNQNKAQGTPLFLTLSDDADQYIKGKIDLSSQRSNRRLSDLEVGWIQTLDQAGRIDLHFNLYFFFNGNSSEPELAGIFGALVGSALTLLVTLIASLPLGIASAIYLEEFAPRTWLTGFIEVNINNLAAVPSVIYGLLGLFLFLGVMNLPRSSPLVGGLTLALMTFPIIIIASRAAIRAVPDDTRLAAMALGASRMQVVFHHVVPMALPGIMTGTIIGMSRAIGETAPLLMIGMVAFISSAPENLSDPSTVLPVQIFLWSKGSERAFLEKTSAAILVLLIFLIIMNAFAIWLRHRFDRKNSGL